ncbi:MAG TPA: signal peptidase II [Anaerolineaceae bacterium]|nr:signal peptidase II [Anaerolineaceae bacterium]HPN51620.1 signal peptidase II [Anaerolineaceae bacterium]
MRDRKSLLFNYAFLLGGAALIVLLDQYTKELVRQNIPLGGSWMPLEWLAPYARFVHWTNSGAAFGMLQDKGLIFAILAVIVSIGIIYYFPRVAHSSWGMRIALTMQLGGALGNLVDRVLFNGEVTDFISVGSFAVFNVADSSITVGVAILILVMLLEERRSQQKALETPAAEPVEAAAAESVETPAAEPAEAAAQPSETPDTLND